MRRLQPIILSVLFVTYLASATHAESFITNAAELVSLTDAEMKSGKRFELKGTVLTGFPHLFKTSDATILLHGDIRDAHVNPGDVVFVRGETMFKVVRTYYVTTTRKLSTVDPPEPEDIDPLLLSRGRADLRYAAVRGHVDAIFVDEIDSRFVYVVLNSNGVRLPVTISEKNLTPTTMSDMNGADIEVYGTMLPATYEPSLRQHVDRTFKTWSNRPVRIIKPAERDPASCAALPFEQNIPAQDIAKLGRRHITGTVLAAWGPSSILLQGLSNRLHRIELTAGQHRPSPGDIITAAGTVETDLYNLNLSHAICRVDGKDRNAPMQPSAQTDPAKMLSDGKGNRQFDPRFHGKTVRLRGIVCDSAEFQGASRFELNCGKHIIPVILGNPSDMTMRPSVGSKVDVTGCCVMDVDNWLPTEPFPRIRGIFIVTRTPNDIELISNPPWWTPARFAIALFSVLTLLIATLIWNEILRRLVEKRSRELTDEQVAHAKSEFRAMERTSLAIELHDTLSQDLSAVACQIDATSRLMQSNPHEASRTLDTLGTMLVSCRTELKRCLWDLRNETLEDVDMTHAIHRTLQPLMGTCELTVRFNVPRDCLTDSSAHAVLCIVRELVSNALTHGKATSVRIAGALDGDCIRFSVTDNGSGFAPDRRPGPDSGHFGLAGVEARTKRLHGKMNLRSAPGKGTRAAISILISEPQGK